MTTIGEARRVARFGLVGLTATAAHLAVVAVLGTQSALPVLAIHVVGFLSAFGISFAGHYAYTFRSTRPLQQAAPRFLAVSLCALAASSAIAWLGHAAGLPPMASLLVAAASVPVASYLANRQLVF